MLTVIPVAESSHIAAINYDPETMELIVRFKRSNAVYKYIQVPEDVANGFAQALSAGQYHDLYIKGQFEFQKLS